MTFSTRGLLMDIFTTQLTRVVPLPIKPTHLKVKALLKEAATGQLTQDPDHLEHHDCYFISEAKYQENEQKHPDHAQEYKPTDKKHTNNEGSVMTQREDHKRHLDIFV